MITDEDIVTYTQGDCHELAIAIHKVTGWTTCAFDDYGEPNYHAFVKTPSGTFLDVRGEQTWEELYGEWSKHWWKGAGIEDYIEVHPRVFIDDGWSWHSSKSELRRVRRRARDLAKYLVANLAVVD